MKEAEVRISVANLVWDAVNIDTGEVVRIGVQMGQSFHLQQGGLWAPLGGAATLTNEGIQYLKDTCGAHSFEQDPKSGSIDFRCIVEQRHVDKVFDDFKSPLSGMEKDHAHDIIAELKSFDLFSSSELSRLWLNFDTSVRQTPSGAGEDTSVRAKHKHTMRLFRIHELWMPGKLFDKLCKQKYIRPLTMSEVATTKGGRVRGITTDGQGIQNNFF